MSEVKDHLRYSAEHEWVEAVGERTVRIGITDFAQCQLGDIVFVDCAAPGAGAAAGDSIGSIESVKTVSELYSPVAGTIVKVNAALELQPELVNEDPYGGGWIAELEVDGTADEAVKSLLTAEEYRAHVAD